MPPRHKHTDAPVEGSAPSRAGVRAKQRLWDLRAVVPKWAPRPPPQPRTTPAAALELELRTARALSRLRLLLSELARQHGLAAKTRALTFERWRFAAIQEEAHAGAAGAGGGKREVHPVLPSGSASPVADAALVDELGRQGLGADAAKQIVRALGAKAGKLHKLLTARAHRIASGGGVGAKPLSVRFNRHGVELVCHKRLVRCSRDAYGKLAIQHRRHAREDERAPPPSVHDNDGDEAAEAEAAAEAAMVEGSDDARDGLHARLFALLLRYKSIQGHGFQAAIGPPVWEVCRARLGVAVECFASPLNAYLPAYGSAFADVDAPFGSRGDFFKFAPLAGSFCANPPFVHEVMDAMAAHILRLLSTSAAAAGGPALSFVVILPGWEEGTAYTALSGSPFCRAKVVIAARDHGFADGSAHSRQDPYRHSPFDTAVLVLQTDKASRKWPANSGEFIAEIHAAFGACKPTDAAVGRQLKKSASALPRKAPRGDAPTGGAGPEEGGKPMPRTGAGGRGKPQTAPAGGGEKARRAHTAARRGDGKRARDDGETARAGTAAPASARAKKPRAG